MQILSNNIHKIIERAKTGFVKLIATVSYEERTKEGACFVIYVFRVYIFARKQLKRFKSLQKSSQNFRHAFCRKATCSRIVVKSELILRAFLQAFEQKSQFNQ